MCGDTKLQSQVVCRITEQQRNDLETVAVQWAANRDEPVDISEVTREAIDRFINEEL